MIRGRILNRESRSARRGTAVRRSFFIDAVCPVETAFSVVAAFAAALVATLSSCAIFAPATFASARLPSADRAAVRTADLRTLENVEWTPIAAGLDFCAVTVEEPCLEFRAIRADLTAPGLSVVVTRPGADFATVRSTRVSSFLDSVGAAAAVNAAPFSPSSGREGEARTITGIAVADGILYASPDPRYAALLFGDDGAAYIAEQAELKELHGIRSAVGGFFVVLKGGAAVGDTERRHPRTAAGIGAGGRTLYLLVIDGRRKASVGATEVETGEVLERLGAEEGLILDGGGSTAMAVRDDEGRAVLVNIPIHGGIPGLQRAVATCVGIIARPIEEPLP